MSIQFKTNKVDGFDKTIQLYGEGYVGKPVTLNKSTIAGLTANANGNYIIPQGTYLTGATGSLLDNPQQMAIQAVVAESNATATVNSSVVVTAKDSGELVYTISLVKDASTNPVDPTDGSLHGAVSYDAATKKLVVTLAVDKKGNIVSTYADVVALINNDLVANSLVVASIATGVDETTTAAVTAADVKTAGGGAETVTGIIDGILLHSVDVTDGEAFGAMMIAGYVNVDNMPAVPGTAVKAALPRITFSRID